MSCKSLWQGILTPASWSHPLPHPRRIGASSSSLAWRLRVESLGAAAARLLARDSQPPDRGCSSAGAKLCMHGQHAACCTCRQALQATTQPSGQFKVCPGPVFFLCCRPQTHISAHSALRCLLNLNLNTLKVLDSTSRLTWSAGQPAGQAWWHRTATGPWQSPRPASTAPRPAAAGRPTARQLRAALAGTSRLPAASGQRGGPAWSCA